LTMFSSFPLAGGAEVCRPSSTWGSSGIRAIFYPKELVARRGAIYARSYY
jgi:hypothetical protein